MDAPVLTFEPVTPERWDDFAALFERPGSPKYCWCMAFRPFEGKRAEIPGPARKPFIEARIKAGVPVGLLGYHDGEAIAWVSIAPKATYERLGGPNPGPGEDIWSLACMFVVRRHRGGGLARQLIAAAVAEARAQGATAVEAYPVDPDAPSYRFMGFVPAFVAAGFVPAGTSGSRRHVMRLNLSGAQTLTNP